MTKPRLVLITEEPIRRRPRNGSRPNGFSKSDSSLHSIEIFDAVRWEPEQVSDIFLRLNECDALSVSISGIQQPDDCLDWYVALQLCHCQSGQRIFQPGIGRSEVVPELYDRADTRAAQRHSFRQRRDCGRDCFKGGALLVMARKTTVQRPDTL
ncbi:MAG: hypothetical protein AB7F89_24285 [Pirellulaceae bacterium]